MDSIINPLYSDNRVMVSKSQYFCDCRTSEVSISSVTSRPWGDKYLHIPLMGDSSLSCLYTYNVSVKSNVDTEIQLYTLVMGKMYWQITTSNKFASANLKAEKRKKFQVNTKFLFFVTRQSCTLDIKVSVEDKVGKFLDIPYELVDLSGHRVLHLLMNGEDKRSIRAHYDTFAIPLTSYILNSTVGAGGINISNMEYYLNLSSLLTITRDVEQQYRYPPYSVKVNRVDGKKAVLNYRLLFKPDVEEITVTCIESLSKSTYAIIHDENGKKLTMDHTGNKAEGSFTLPNSCIDVGLHVYSPYGFCLDVGDDPDTDAVRFEAFELTYI